MIKNNNQFFLEEISCVFYNSSQKITRIQCKYREILLKLYRKISLHKYNTQKEIIKLVTSGRVMLLYVKCDENKI